jgi:signal transduction histidine kinase
LQIAQKPKFWTHLKATGFNSKTEFSLGADAALQYFHHWGILGHSTNGNNRCRCGNSIPLFENQYAILANKLDISQIRPEIDQPVLLSQVFLQSNLVTRFADPQQRDTSSQKPLNFVANSCGRLMRRDAKGNCVLCPLHTLNRAGNAGDEERCTDCPSHHKLIGSECVSQFAHEIAMSAAILAAIISLLFILRNSYRIRDEGRKLEIQARLEKKFISFAFHEVKNPLNGMVGSLDFVEEEIQQLSTLLSPSISPVFRIRSDSITSGGNVSISSDSIRASSFSDIDTTCNDESPEATGSTTNRITSTISSCLYNIDNCQACTKHAMDVLLSVLDLFKVAENKFTMAKQPVNLVQLMQDLAKAS